MKRIAAGAIALALTVPAAATALPIGDAGRALKENQSSEAWVAKKRLPRNHDLWVRIGRCEQPGRGYKGINWSHPGPRYQGGLGFYSGTWAAFKEPHMPGNAGQATWRQQMWVANKLYARYGTSPWGCG